MPTEQQIQRALQAGYTPQQIKLALARSKQTNNQQTIGGFLGNVVKSGAQFVGDTASGIANVFNPNMEKNTLANVARLGESVLEVLMPGEQGNEALARRLGEYYVNRYGGLDKAWNSFYNDPVGVTMDVATVLTGAGGLVKGAGKLSGMNKLTKAGTAIGRAGEFIDPITQTGKFIKRSVPKVVSKAGRGMETTGRKMTTRGIGNPAMMDDLGRKFGTTADEFIDKYNLYDRSSETARKVRRGIINKYDEIAMKSGTSVPMESILGSFDQEIARLKNGVNGVISEATQSKIAELEKRKDLLVQAAGGTVIEATESTPKAYANIPNEIPTANLVEFRRQVIDPDVPKSMYNLDARGSGSAQGVKTSRDIIKGAIDSTDPRLNRLGMDYGMAKGMEKILGRSESRANNRQVFNFTKLGSAGIGSIVAGAPGVVAGFAAEQAVNNPRVIAATSKALKHGGRAIQGANITPFLNNVGNVAGGVYGAGKAARMINQPQQLPISPNTQRLPQSQPRLRSYTPSVTPNDRFLDAAVMENYKQPKVSTKNVFKNRSAFGKIPKIKANGL